MSDKPKIGDETDVEKRNLLLAEAAALGVDVDGRWANETLERHIERARSEVQRQIVSANAPVEAQTADDINELEAQMEAEAKAPKGPAATLLVYLDYDTWIDDVRIHANKDVPVELPRLRAKELLVVGKARRADPLPGDE